MRGQTPGDYRGLDASAVKTTGGPVAGDGQVVERMVGRRYAVALGSGQRKNIAVAWVDVCPPVLGVEARLADRPCLLSGSILPVISQGFPFESCLPPAGFGPQLNDLVIE